MLFKLCSIQVSALIQRERFEHVPVGPLGEYIRLQDQKYANQIAYICKNQLESYACSNYADMTKLKAILNKVYGDRSPSIIVQQVSDAKYTRVAPCLLSCPFSQQRFFSDILSDCVRIVPILPQCKWWTSPIRGCST
jgi:chromosome segregation ATPase